MAGFTLISLEYLTTLTMKLVEQSLTTRIGTHIQAMIHTGGVDEINPNEG